MPSNNLALSIVKPCVRVGGSTVASFLPRTVVTADNRQHLSSEFFKQQSGDQHQQSLSCLGADKRFLTSEPLPTAESEGVKELPCSRLPSAIDIPTLEAARVRTTLDLLGCEHIENLSSVHVKLNPLTFITETEDCTVPLAGAAPLALTGDANVVEEPPKEVNMSGKTEKRRRAKANAKLMHLSVARRVDDLQLQLKKYRTMAVLAEMRHQQQLVIRSWAAVSARQRRDVAKQKQLHRQRKMHAMKVIRAHLDHEQQLVLRSWSAVATDSLKARMHQREMDALRCSTDSDCPLPPGLFDIGTKPDLGMEPTLENQRSGCTACLSSWGCLQHSVYYPQLFLAQRELGMKIDRGPPGLTLDENPVAAPSSHLRLASLSDEVKLVPDRKIQSKIQRKKWQWKKGRD